MRAAVEGYRSHGLRGELQSAARALTAAGVALDADVAAVTLPPKQETVLALAVREAITNVVRHAGATTCRISLQPHSGGIVLRIEDDGVGGVPSEGHGLSGMRERIASIGGTLAVDAGTAATGRLAAAGAGAPGAAATGHRTGFAVTVTVP